MPEGIIATVDGGFATVDFVDTALRGPSLQKLLDIGGPGTIETITRQGPRRKYRVPLGNAEEAGLVDGTEIGRVHSAGHDTGAAEALTGADPNLPGRENGADWHTPTAEHSSANSFVAATNNNDVLGSVSPSTANQNAETGEGFGGSPSPTTHADLIEHVKANSDVRAVGGVLPVRTPDPARSYINPGAAANLGLADQYGAHPNDPGATFPTGGGHDHTAAAPALIATPEPEEIPEPETSPGTVGVPVEDDGRPEGLPEGEPTEDWRRPQLDAYASWKGIPNAAALPNKPAVLEAIAKGPNS